MAGRSMGFCPPWSGANPRLRHTLKGRRGLANQSQRRRVKVGQKQPADKRQNTTKTRCRGMPFQKQGLPVATILPATVICGRKIYGRNNGGRVLQVNWFYFRARRIRRYPRVPGSGRALRLGCGVFPRQIFNTMIMAIRMAVAKLVKTTACA